jgi:hypothetical protein
LIVIGNETARIGEWVRLLAGIAARLFKGYG